MTTSNEELWAAYRVYEAEVRASSRSLATVTTYLVHVRRFIRWIEEHPQLSHLGTG
jgi:hypothetical protein